VFARIYIVYDEDVSMTSAGERILAEHGMAVKARKARYTFVFDQGKWFRRRDYFTKPKPHQEDRAFDGKVYSYAILTRNVPTAIRLTRLEREAERSTRGDKKPLFPSRYFEAIGLDMPDTIAELRDGKAPRHMILSLLSAPSVGLETVTKEEGGTLIQLGNKTDQLRYRFWLAADRGYALEKWQMLAWDDRILISYFLNQHELIPGTNCWAPRMALIEEYVRPSLEPHDTPLLLREIEVQRITRTTPEATRFALDYDKIPGVWVYNGIHPDAKLFPRGEIAYQAPATPEDLERMVRQLTSGDGRRAVLWASLVIGIMVASVYVVRLLRTRRSAAGDS